MDPKSFLMNHLTPGRPVLLKGAAKDWAFTKVRKTPSWPRSWANFSYL